MVSLAVEVGSRVIWPGFKAGLKVTISPEGKTPSSKRPVVAFLLDASGSMAKYSGVRRYKASKIDVAKKALRDAIESLPNGSRVYVYAFSSAGVVPVVEGVLLSKVTRLGVFEKLEEVAPKGETPMYRALREACEKVSKFSDNFPFIVLLTDGVPSYVKELRAYEKLVEDMKRVRARAVCVGIGVEYNEALLSLIAEGSGGWFIHVGDDNIDSLPAIFREIVRHSVVYGYDATLTLTHAAVDSLEVYGAVERVDNTLVLRVGELTGVRRFYGVLEFGERRGEPGTLFKVLEVILTYRDIETGREEALREEVVLPLASSMGEFMDNNDLELLHEAYLAGGIISQIDASFLEKTLTIARGSKRVDKSMVERAEETLRALRRGDEKTLRSHISKTLRGV